jgi:hypothetical protein
VQVFYKKRQDMVATMEAAKRPARRTKYLLEQCCRQRFFYPWYGRQAPDWVTIFTTDRKHKMKSKSATIEWLVCDELVTLLF